MVTAINTALADAVGDWLAAHDRGLTDPEKTAFRAWLSASPTHAAAWEKVNAVWASYDEAPDPLLESWRNQALATRPQAWRPSYLQAAAAAIVIVLGGGAFAVMGLKMLPASHLRPGHEIASAAEVTYSAGPSQRNVVLPDGTRVQLDARSSISVRHGTVRRDVALVSGRAYFNVAHDAHRPFVVAAAGQTVTDVGTAFGVSLQPDGVSVVLTEGSVSIAPGAGRRTVALTPGEQYVGPSSGAVSVSDVDVDRALAWRSGFAEFKATPLADAVAEMNRYSATSIVVDDARAGALPISGRYQTGDADGFTRSVTAIYGLASRRDAGGQIHIRSQ